MFVVCIVIIVTEKDSVKQGDRGMGEEEEGRERKRNWIWHSLKNISKSSSYHNTLFLVLCCLCACKVCRKSKKESWSWITFHLAYGKYRYMYCLYLLFVLIVCTYSLQGIYSPGVFNIQRSCLGQTHYLRDKYSKHYSVQGNSKLLNCWYMLIHSHCRCFISVHIFEDHNNHNHNHRY